MFGTDAWFGAEAPLLWRAETRTVCAAVRTVCAFGRAEVLNIEFARTKMLLWAVLLRGLWLLWAPFRGSRPRTDE